MNFSGKEVFNSTGYGLRATGYGLRATGYGLRATLGIALALTLSGCGGGGGGETSITPNSAPLTSSAEGNSSSANTTNSTSSSGSNSSANSVSTSTVSNSAIPVAPIAPNSPASSSTSATATLATASTVISVQIPATLQNIGLQYFELLKADDVIVKGQIFDGILNYAFGNADSSNIVFEAVSGVVSQITKNQLGLWVFRVDARQLSSGQYAYVIRVRDTKTGISGNLQGNVPVVEPLETLSVKLDSSEKTISTAQGSIRFSSNQLSSPVNLTVSVIAINGGIRYRIQSPVSLKNNGVKVQLPTSASSRTLPKSLQEKWREVQLGFQNFRQAGSFSPSLNTNPYSAGPQDLSGVTSIGNFSGNSLGTLIAKGNPETAFQDLKINENVLDEQLNNSQPSLGFQRLWEDPRPAVGTEPEHWWQIPGEVVRGLVNDYIYETFVEQKVPWELHSSIQGLPNQFDWTGYEPVLFIHGFSLSYGGGEDTWAKFPKLLLQTQLPNGNSLVPFEFRWTTNQSFRLAADDLALAISKIYIDSGRKPVHIVAHSMGGALVRTLLQGLGKTPSHADATKPRIASLMSLGTPYSGISPSEQQVSASTLPKGTFQNVDFISACASVTCFELGGAAIFLKLNFASIFQNIGLTGDYATKGMLAAHIKETETNLPAIPIYQGIGLQALLPSNTVLADGDGLISFAGQRFQASRNNDAIASPLLNQTKIGQASVTEVILGYTPLDRPNSITNTNQLPSRRQHGYAHASTAGLGNFNLWISDGGGIFGRGLEAAPTAECDSAASCVHASFLLFLQIQNRHFKFPKSTFSYDNQYTPGTLKVRAKLTDGTNLNSEQISHAQKALDFAKSKGLISGGYINWSLLSLADMKSAWTILNNVPDVPRVAQLKTQKMQEAQVLDNYYRANLSSANWAAVGEGLYGKGALKDWVDVAIAEADGIKGALTIFWPEAAAALSAGSTVVGSANAKRALIYMRATESSSKWLGLMSKCPLIYSDYLAAVSKLDAGDYRGEHFITAISAPLSCIASVYDVANKDAQATVYDLLSTSVQTSTGETLKIAQLFLKVFDLGLGLFPANELLVRGKGIIEVLAATADAYEAGIQMEKRANAAYAVRSAEIEETAKIWDEKLNLARYRVLLTAKAASIYEPGLGNIQANSSPSLSIGERVRIWVSDASSFVVNVAWTFSDGVHTFTTEVVNGVSNAIDYVFNNAGNVTVTATYRDAGGNTLGSSNAVFSVAAPLAQVTYTAAISSVRNNDVSPTLSIIKGGQTTDTTPLLSGTISHALSSAYTVNVYDGSNLLGAASVSGTSWTYQATSLSLGSHTFTVRVALAYSVEGAASAPWTMSIVGLFGGICGQTINFDNNALPSGWTANAVRVGPGVIRNRLEASPTDGGAYITSSDSVMPSSVKSVVVEFTNSRSYAYWGMGNHVQFKTSGGRYWEFSDWNSDQIIGVGFREFRIYESSVPANSLVGGVSYYELVAAKLAMGLGMFKTRVTVSDGLVTWSVVDSLTGVSYPASATLPSGFKVANLVSSIIGVNATTDGTGWIDDVSIQCLP